MKNILKKLILILLYYSFRNRQDSGLLVLNYHRITDNPDYDDPLKVSKYTFEKQIQYLKENFKLISGDDLLEIIKKNETLQNNTCLITFDDGWRDNYTNAYPVLKKYNVPAIIFISTDFVGTNNIFWHEQLQELLNNMPINKNDIKLNKLLIDWPDEISKSINDILKQQKSKRQLKINELISILKSFDTQAIKELIIKLSKHYNQKLIDKPLVLSWREIHEMSKNNISFGSHTKSHPILTQIEDDIIINELIESKLVLEKHLNKPIHYFSYPNGNYNQKIANIVKEAGYVAAFAMVSGVKYTKSNLFEIKRNMIKEQSSSVLNGKFSELFFKVELSDIRNRIKQRSMK